MLTVVGTNLTEKVRNQKVYFIFPPRQTSASVLPGETRNPEIASFHLNTACFLSQAHEAHLKTSPGTAEPPFTVQTIDCVHQTGPEGSIASSSRPHS